MSQRRLKRETRIADDCERKCFNALMTLVNHEVIGEMARCDILRRIKEKHEQAIEKANLKR